ncbi:MAG: DUF1998 domain-containing protein [Syntrophomonadaceae bacterium]|nr:DUF1998 domain-containing protein [Syntrophomonadaceae bacterium]
MTGTAIVLFDDVPGGAGHVRRITNPSTLIAVLWAALRRMETCQCGGSEGNTSCYECLRNYRNQFCHKELKRGPAIEFLRKVLDAI